MVVTNPANLIVPDWRSERHSLLNTEVQLTGTSPFSTLPFPLTAVSNPSDPSDADSKHEQKDCQCGRV